MKRTYSNTFPIKQGGAPALIKMTTETRPSDLTFEQLTEYMDAEVVASLARDIDLGVTEIVDILVTAEFGELKGFDSLGGCFVSRPSDVDESVFNHDMEHVARENLISRMEESYDVLNLIFGKVI